MNTKHTQEKKRASRYFKPVPLSYAYGTLGHFGKPSSEEWQKRDRAEGSRVSLLNASAHYEDRVRQAKEAHLDWDYVGQILKLDPEVTLEEAKQMAREYHA